MDATANLVTRAFGCPYGYRRYGNTCVRRSNWYYWGRWVVVGIILIFLLLTLVCCMITARRRRRRGQAPYYGTGWMANGKQWGQNDPNNYNNYNMNGYNNGGYNQGNYNQGNYNPPPAYGTQQQQPQYTGSTFNPNDGYYGQQTGVQSPPNAYQREAYPPPAGPPPGK